MVTIAALLVLVCLVGIIWPKPLAFMGLRKRWQYLCLGLVAFVSVGIFAPKPDGTSGAPASSTSVSTPKAPAGTVKLASFSWRKESFGSIMMADFSISNSTDRNVKDIEITCRHTAASGTEIDRNTRTIYQVVPSRGQIRVDDFNMGFIHSQATSTNCSVTDYTNS